MTTFADLEAQRADVLARIDVWPPAAVAARPGPARWSAAEVLDHLVRTERGILDAAVQGLAAPHRRGLRDRVGVQCLDWLFRSDRRVRVPASAEVAVRPASDANVEAVRRDWDTVRLDLVRFLAPLAPGQLTGGVFRHPVAGWMRVPDVLRFFWVHTHHHGFQLARLREEVANDHGATPALGRGGGMPTSHR